MKKGKLDKKQLLRNAGLLCGLRKISGTSASARNCLEETLLEIGRQQQSQWRMDDSEIADFARRVALRVRCMCRHFAKADARATPARCIQQIKAMEGMAILDDKANHGGDIAKVIGLDSESEGSHQPELKEVASLRRLQRRIQTSMAGTGIRSRWRKRNDQRSLL